MSDTAGRNRYSRDEALEEANRLKALTGEKATQGDFSVAEELDEASEDKRYFSMALEILRKHNLPYGDFRPYSGDVGTIFKSYHVNELLSYYADILAFRELGIDQIDRSADGITSAQARAREQGKDYYIVRDQIYDTLTSEFKEIANHYERRTDIAQQQNLKQESKDSGEN